MPGTKDAKVPSKWFKKSFGFFEGALRESRRQFEFADGVLLSKANDRQFYVGPFDLLSLEELQARLAEVTEKKPNAMGGLTFDNVVETTHDLHVDPENAGAVFQSTSLFNCLEMCTQDRRPDDGVTACVGSLQTQGAACAAACPAATVFRQYFVNGVGQVLGAKQLDCLSGVAELLHNDREGYWGMKNGFCLPKPPGKIGQLSKRLQHDPNLSHMVRGAVKVGVHWDTEVWGGKQRVTQVLCSTVPVAQTKMVKASEWAAFARLLLEAAFEATLTVAAILAAERQERVQVYLTAVGAGVLGNRLNWVVNAISRSLGIHKNSPIDVALVHFAFPPQAVFTELERGWTHKQPAAIKSITQRVRELNKDLDELHEEVLPQEDEQELAAIQAHQIARCFQYFDMNGDGVIDRSEFMSLLQHLDAYFFSISSVDAMLKEADADGNGNVHYAEFAAWLTGASTEAVLRNLFTASLAKADLCIEDHLLTDLPEIVAPISEEQKMAAKIPLSFEDGL